MIVGIAYVPVGFWILKDKHHIPTTATIGLQTMQVQYT
jgi:hypothetical protein